MTSLRLSTYSVVKGDPLTLTVSDHPDLSSTAVMGLGLCSVEEAETVLRLSTGLTATFANGELVATIGSNVSGTLREDHLYEVAYLKPTDAQGNELVSLLGGSDFPRTFFRVKADSDEPNLTAEEAAQNAREIQGRSEELYAEPLGDPNTTGAREFRVLMFIERLNITRVLRVPGLRMIPFIESERLVRKFFGLGGSDELEFMNYVLRDMGWIDPQAEVDPSWWRNTNSENRPVVVIDAPRVFGTSEGHALRTAHGRRDYLLRLLAFNRESSGVPFATAVQRFDPISGLYQDFKLYSEIALYAGNLLGGIASGEDQSLLLADDRAMRTDRFLGFVLHLHAEAQEEKDLDFAYFRYWNLLETIASERVEKETSVTDFSGATILTADGKPFTTDGARGRVHELVRRGMQVHDYKEDYHQQARDLSLGLWEAIHVWYAFRNATTHHGGFNPEDSKQKLQPWYEVAMEAQRSGAQPRGYRQDPYFDYLKTVTRDVIHWELESSRAELARKS